MAQRDKLRFEQTTPDLVKSLVATQTSIDASGFDRTIHHLCVLRASQMNGCAFCVAMHIKEARDDGESQERLDQLVVWRETDLFSEKERAALAWVEAMTTLDEAADWSAAWRALVRYFSDQEICSLTVDIGMINLWNRINVARQNVNRLQQD